MACAVCPWRLSQSRNVSPLIRRSGRSEHRHGSADGHLVAKAQTVRPKKCRRGVQWSRQGRRADHGCAPSGLEERQLLIPANLVLNARATDRNRAGWCSSRATHAGNCRQFRRCRDADKKRRARRDKDGAQTASRETRLPPRRIQRPGPPTRRRRSRLWKDCCRIRMDRISRSRAASQQTLQHSFSEDRELFGNR